MKDKKTTIPSVAFAKFCSFCSWSTSVSFSGSTFDLQVTFYITVPVEWKSSIVSACYDIFLKIKKIHKIIYLCSVYVHEYSTWGSQGTTWGVRVCHSTVWNQEAEVRSLGLLASTFTAQPSCHPSGALFFQSTGMQKNLGLGFVRHGMCSVK